MSRPGFFQKPKKQLRQEERSEEVPNTTLEHLCKLSIRDPPLDIKRTGIICTIGPRSNNVDVLRQMIESGMNIARLNFSHGSYEYHAASIATVRKAVQSFSDNRQIAIALDTKGPEIRTGVLSTGTTAEVELVKGKQICVTTDSKYKDACTTETLYVDYQNICKVVSKESRVYIDDGLISLVVDEIKDGALYCTIENGGMLGSRKGVNLPGTKVDLPAVSEKDIQDLKFGIEQGVDMIFASFIRNANGVRCIRKVLGEKGRHIKIIAKIENQEGMDNCDEIIAEADGIMVARGDLGIEIPTEKIFVAQKMLIAKCNRAGKPVVCATQMLESVTYKPRPTRAEACDVANAVLDGADCVMLSGETAKGQYPIEAVKTMAFICREAEAAFPYRRFFKEAILCTVRPTDMTMTIALAANIAADNCHAAAIIVTTSCGRSAMCCSRYRGQVPIIAVCKDASACRQMNICRAVFPVYYNKPSTGDYSAELGNKASFGLAYGKDRGIISRGDYVVVVNGWRPGCGFTNSMRIITAN